MTLCLHAGASPIDYDGLRQLETPKGTASHVPLPHFRLVDLVANSLGYFGHTVQDQHHGVTPDGMRYFGVLSLKSPYTGYTDMIGLRNSHDKSLPVGISFGSQVFVCDNLAFSADHVIRTKHTANLKMRLPGLVGELIEPIAEQRESQHRKLLAYQNTALTDSQADAAIMQLYRKDVITVTKIADVAAEYDVPSHDWGDKTLWRLFNAVTFVLSGRIMENPASTTRLHTILDGIAETIH